MQDSNTPLACQDLSKLRDCICAIWNAEQEGLFNDTSIGTEALMYQISQLFDEMHYLYVDNNGEESYSKTEDYCQNFSMVTEMLNELCGGDQSTLGSVDSRISNVVNLVIVIITQAHDQDINICDALVKSDTDHYFKVLTGSFSKWKNFSECFCKLFNELYPNMEGGAKEEVDTFYEETFLPFYDFLKDKVGELFVEEESGLGEKCQLAINIKLTMQRLYIYCTDNPPAAKNLSNCPLSSEDKEVINAEIETLWDAWENLQDTLDNLGIKHICNNDGHQYTPAYQSAYLYLQAAGSDSNEEEYATGAHLRWAFKNKLGKEHLPKGNLAQEEPYEADQGFNKEDDFVTLYRTEYSNQPYFHIDFSVSPNWYDITPYRKTWIYEDNSIIPGRTVKLHFLDINAYNAINQGLSPKDFLTQYEGVLFIEWENNMLYRADLTFNKEGTDNAFMDFEILSSETTDFVATDHVSCRQKWELGNGDDEKGEMFFCENIVALRVKTVNGYLSSLRLESYREFMQAKSDELTELGKFALTDDEGTAFVRLEDPDRFEIDGIWPRMHDGTKIQVNDYKNAWSAEHGIEVGVKDYLKKSATGDPHAWETLESDDPEDQSTWEISHLEMLKLLSLDFHIARMLGLGYIDEMPEETPDDKRFVYMIEYQVKGSMVGGSDNFMQPHFYMSLPTAKNDYRKPLVPEKPEISFGISNENINKRLFDNEGYSLFHPLRAVNIARKLYPFETAGTGFFKETEPFCTCEKTVPVKYGIAYKQDPQGNFISPEITMPLLDNIKSLFIHKQKESGQHIYYLYGINWFSRLSDLSPQVSVLTELPDNKTPMPPLPFHVQYIQEEITPLFTSANEQTKLGNRLADQTLADPYFTRITFHWTHLHNDQYPGTDKIEFYFRTKLMKEVKGEITEVIDHEDTEKKILKTDKYKSAEDGSDVIPHISSADMELFENALLKSGGKHFIVTEVKEGGDAPELVVRGLRRENIIESAEIKEVPPIPVFPEADNKFTLMENPENINRWSKLKKEVTIKHFEVDGYSPYYKEERTDDEGNHIILNAGGFYGSAEIEKKFDEFKGVYRIKFEGTELDNHPDEDVEWYGGVARAPVDDNDGEMRVLEILKFESLDDPLTVWVFDPAANDDNDPGLKTGSEIGVNLHPGYRVYIYNEDEDLNYDGFGFNHTELLPEAGEKNNKLLMTARSVAEKQSAEDKYSVFSNPAVLLVREIIIPETPPKPSGPKFATRPDSYGKSSYTFDTKANTDNGRKPYGFIFYRATADKILDEIYAENTKKEVWENLQDDPYKNEHLLNITNVVLEDGDFVEIGAGNILKEPDNEKLELDGNESTEEKKEILKNAVERAFTPLTERPPIYSFIETGHQTSKEKPKFKDPASGEFMDPNDEAFNPFPFIRKYNDSGTDDTYIRFSDFTLDGASQDIYFYRVKEINDQMEMSDAGEAIGPVRLINTMPPEKPQVKSLKSVSESPALNRKPGVSFRIEPYIKSENVEKVRLYRTTSNENLSHVRLMQFAGDFPVNHIKDEFSDLNWPPFGLPVYYRIVALRKILSEYKDDQDNNLEEFVPSKPSGPVVANVIDAVNPPAPEISIYHFDQNNDTLTNVILLWPKTTHNGKYRLYKMSAAGNWQKIHTVASNDAYVFVKLENTDLDNPELQTKDQQDNPVYHHFKVAAENSSGLISREEHIKSLGASLSTIAYDIYKNYVADNNGSIVDTALTYEIFRDLLVSQDHSFYVAFAGLELTPDNKVHQWFNLNTESQHLLTPNQDDRAEWTGIFREIARIAIEKSTENKINAPDQSGDNSTDWLLAGVSANSANSFFNRFDSWELINNGSNSHRTAQSVAISGPGIVTFSVVVEKGTAQACRLRIWDGNVQGRFSFDLINEQPLTISGEHIDYRKLSDNGPNGGEVWILAVTAQVNNSNITIDFWPDENGNGGYTFVHFTQLEESKYYTLPVDGERVAARPVLPDFLPSSDGSGEGTVCFWVDFVNDPEMPLHFMESDGNSNLSLNINNNGVIELKWYDGNVHLNVLNGILPLAFQRVVRFIAVTWNNNGQLHLYWGDTDGNLQKTDTLYFTPGNINTKDIRPGQSENGSNQTSVMFHLLKADNHFRDDNVIEQLYNNLRQIIF